MKRVILRVMMLVAMASAAVYNECTYKFERSKKQLKEEMQLQNMQKALQGIDTDTVDQALQKEQIVQDSQEESTRSLENVFHIPQVHREDMVRK